MPEDNIPDKFIQKIREAKENQLEALDLSNSGLTKIPEVVFELKYIKILNLHHNKIGKLPEYINNLSNLTQLNLSYNQLRYLPESIGDLSNLVYLSLHNNQLINLPKSIGNLSNLTELFLHHNQLQNIPESIGNLSNLTHLYLSQNQLKNISESIGNLSNLTDLRLSRNRLTNIPESMGNLSNLFYLSLYSNQLKNISESIGNLSNSTELYLSGNPLVAPPPEVVKKGIEAIREYFRQLKEKGEDYIYEAKLLIVGEGGAGKTSLARKIQDAQYELQEREPSTEGIDVIKWSFPIFDKQQKEQDFKVNIWDFGGQEIYHTTHQFFLTKRSLYTLVADTRKDDTDFYYWLNIVELLSDNSPTLIIKNEKQDRKVDINEPALKRQFTNLKETLATNLKTNKNLDEIINSIQCYIRTLPHIGQTLPKTWIKVRQVLENNSRNYISLQEYLDICENNGFTKLEDKLQLSGYLHDLGVCLHFQDEEDSLLYKTIILKPEWGTDAVYKVLDNQKVIDNQGHFTRNDLKEIWHEEKYKLMRGELLELMKKFELCYETPENKDNFIAPQLLTKEEPEYEWNNEGNLVLSYTYNNFMPKGIIIRFIVIMHQYIEQHKYVWRNGVILNKNNTKAKIIENYDERKIKINIIGENKQNLMTIITY